MGQGPARRACARRRRPDSRSATASRPTSWRSGTASSASRCPASRSPSGSPRSSTRSRSRSRCSGRPAGSGSPRPVRWLCARLDEAVVLGDGTSYGHRFTSGRIEIPSARELCGDVAGARRRAGRGRAPSADRRGAAGRLARSAREARRGRPPRREPGRARGRVRRALPRAARAGDRDGDAGPPALLPARGRPLRVRRERRRPRARDPRQRARARGPARRCDLHVRARPRRRDRAAPGRLGSITFFQGAGSFADKTERLVRLVERLGGGDATREAARLSKADQASELVREFPDLEGHIGAEYARAAGHPEAVVRRDRRALPSRRRRRAAAVDRGGPRALGRRQDRQPHRRLRARAQAERLP